LPGVRWWDDDAPDGIEFEQDVLVDAPFSFHVVVVVVPFCRPAANTRVRFRDQSSNCGRLLAAPGPLKTSIEELL
jgi:hypothetical protein